LKIYPLFAKGDHSVLLKLMKKYEYDVDEKPVDMHMLACPRGFGKGKGTHVEPATTMHRTKRDTAMEKEEGRKKLQRLVKHTEV
jgi:hypothetical protein